MTSRFVLHANDAGRDRVRENCERFLSSLPASKSWVIEVRPYSKKRTPSQLAAMFGVIYAPLMAHFGLQGARDQEDLHRHLCCLYFGEHPQVPGKPLRSTTYNARGERDEINTVTMNDFIAFIQRWAVEEHGVFVQDPDPLRNAA